MVLTDRQRSDLHAGIYEYLMSQDGKHFEEAAEALSEADPSCIRESFLSKQAGSAGSLAGVPDDISIASRFSRMTTASTSTSATRSANLPILERKWTSVPRLQRKIMELEKTLTNNAKMYAHRGSVSGNITPMKGGLPGSLGSPSGMMERRNLPRQPHTHSLQGHMAVITCVAVHPKFTIAASGSEDGTIKLWDHESGDYMRTLKGHTNTVRSVTFTPSGTHLASSSSDLTIKLWDVTTYNCVRTLRGHDHTISAVRFIPMSMKELNENNSSSNQSNEGAGGKSDWDSSTTGIDALKAGASFLLSASRDTTIKFWDLETGFCSHTISEHKDWVRCLAVRESDGDYIASAGNEHHISVYSTSGKRNKVATLYGHEHVIECLAFVTSPTPVELKDRGTEMSDSKKKDSIIDDYLASGGRDRSVRLWNITTSECIASFTYHENWVRSVIIHPSGKYIISCGDDRTIRIMDINAKRCLRTLEDAHPHFVTCLAMHHTLPIMISGGVDQTVNCWQLD